MPETLSQQSIDIQTDPSARIAELDPHVARELGGALVKPLVEIELPDGPSTTSNLLPSDKVDTSNVATANMMMDAYEAGMQSQMPTGAAIEQQVNEAWENHTGANTKQQLDEAEEANKQADAEMEATIEQSLTDKLTGLKNREALELLITKVGIEGISGVALVDLNDFKGANDNFGHRAGDQVLQRFAALAQKRLSGDENMPGSELGEIFRTGGDEFAIAFYGGRKLEDIQQAITDIEAETSVITFGPEDNPLPDAKRTTWTAGSSIGFAPSNEFSDLSTGLSLADQDMFARKEANRPAGYVGRGEKPTDTQINESLPDHF